MTRRVLVVDHEPQLLRALDVNLSAQSYAVATAPDGTSALRLASRRPPDAVIVDLALPDVDGTDVITGLRACSSMPVIALSEHAEPADVVEVLDAGADDCVPKPFAMEELLARLRAVLRRTDLGGGPRTVSVGAYAVDLAACTVTGDAGRGEPVHLTPTEWHLLASLVRNPGRLVTGHQLLHDIWGPGHDENLNYLRIYIASLRRKLEPDPAHPRHLITEPRMGYRFEPGGGTAR
ncbi:response regulator transcription factor [Streptomyces gibsoniae]|uniref:Response regulator transcription factor n=1 Tax=Streptomyces gibsoniae TaxID=3075529 RepID=A0ABU2TUG2_9ACTN|nr:response regulator transcription factor [Streptomyces sp. DSM 41699]MDT0464602.1 response regulator transcription factor [Streptomyces sp. DSM 41699]